MKNFLRLLPLIAFLPVFAEAGTFAALNRRHFKAQPLRGTSAAHCPEGMIRFEKVDGKFDLMLGPTLHFEWAAAPSLEKEEVEGDCVTSFESSGDESSTKLLTTRANCKIRPFNGTELETLIAVDGSTLEYRRESRDAAGEVRGRPIVCRLKPR